MSNATINDLPTWDNADLRNGRTGTAPILALGDSLTVDVCASARGILPCTDWDAAEYRYPTGLHDVAINVEVTGRKAQQRAGAWWKRARITFVGDCEPDTVVRGWVRSVAPWQE